MKKKVPNPRLKNLPHIFMANSDKKKAGVLIIIGVCLSSYLLKKTIITDM